MHAVRTVDAHAGGGPLRLLVDGAPRPSGRTPAQQAAWLARHADHLRRALVLEPRGHADMLAAQLTEPSAPGAHAGVVFMDADGSRAMSGHGVIAAATIAVERGLFFSREAGPETRLTLETAAGTIHARARVDERAGRVRVDSVVFVNVPAFVHTAGHAISAGGRRLRVDVAYGGVFCAIVDTEAIGVPLTGERAPELRRLGVAIAEGVNGSLAVRHPLGAKPDGVAAVVFTGPAQDPEAHLRGVAVTRGGVVNRAPSGTGMSAVMSVLDAMGLLPDGQPFVLEGLAGAVFRGRATARTAVGDQRALVTEVEGTAWITGEHTFQIDDDDPFREGFRLHA